MQFNAIRALSSQRHSHRHQLLVQLIYGSCLERSLSKAQNACMASGAFSSSFFSRVVLHVEHDVFSPLGAFWATETKIGLSGPEDT